MGRRAAIIGGGIGGLAAAIALGAHGWDVTVFECESDLSGAGTALGLWPGALRALDALGLGAEVRRVGVRQTAGEFRRPDGTVIGVIDVAKLERRTGDPVYLISRPALLGLLQGAVDQSALRFATPVLSVAPLRDECDVVVAADGIFSGVRAELFGRAYRARYTGSTAWRGWVDDLPTQAFVETWGGGAKFGVTPQEGGRSNWYATAPAPERSFAPGAELAAVRRRFGAWASPVHDILDRVTESSILRHDLYAVPRLPTFVRDNVALIGDAAHAMTPDLGRGACEALVDAVALARHLADASTVSAALRGYDRERRRPVQRLATASAGALRLSRQRRLLPLRDALLRLSLRLPVPP